MRKINTVNTQSVKAGRPKETTKFFYCPQCGRKGLYRLRGKYCRCRYCGLYRILTAEPNLKGKQIFLAVVAKQAKIQ